MRLIGERISSIKLVVIEQAAERALAAVDRGHQLVQFRRPWPSTGCRAVRP